MSTTTHHRIETLGSVSLAVMRGHNRNRPSGANGALRCLAMFPELDGRTGPSCARTVDVALHHAHLMSPSTDLVTIHDERCPCNDLPAPLSQPVPSCPRRQLLRSGSMPAPSPAQCRARTGAAIWATGTGQFPDGTL
jgi:hypothetical protein